MSCVCNPLGASALSRRASEPGLSLVLRALSVQAAAFARNSRPTSSECAPRPSVLAIVAAVCLAKAFSCFNATVVAFGHRGNDDSKSLPIPF